MIDRSTRTPDEVASLAASALPDRFFQKSGGASARGAASGRATSGTAHG